MALMFCAVSWGCVKPQPPREPVSEAALERFEYRQVAMGVEARLLFYAHDERRAREAAGAAFAEIARLEALLSDWRADSELSRLGARGPGTYEVSADLATVLDAATRIARFTNGAFDATAAPLVRLWRQAREDGVPPDPTALEAARARVDWRRVRVGGTRVVVDAPGVQLDLGGIAKGHACDRALAVLEALGCGRALVGLGGDLVAGAPPPGRDGWDVRAGCGEAGRPPRRFLLSHAAVATSGDASQHFEHDGVRYSHVVDPRTGRALTDSVCCTVLASSGLVADGYSTALGVAGARVARDALAEGRVREVCLDAPPTDDGAGDGGASGRWIDLLDGDALTGWQAVEGGTTRAPDDYALRAGVLAIPSSAPGGHLITARDWQDLRLALDFRLAPMANGGLFLRGKRGGGDPAYSGCEIQLLDDAVWPWVTNTTLAPWQLAVSLYGAVPAGERRVLFDAGQWNSLDVLYRGSRLAVALNGRLLYDVDTHELSAEPPFLERAPAGFLGLQRYASPHVPGDTAVWIRNFSVQEL
ncbi:MAG: FAD:protein FMN transferase [Planctomycetota bacterium]|jgi:thiamine biosynthesis lipoprotein